MTNTKLIRADGTTLASTTWSEWMPGAKWAWISQCFADDNGDCTPEDIDQEDNQILIKGEVVGYVLTEY